MGRFGREELESAFRNYWQTGAVGEDWAGFADLFTPDALYLEHVLGVRRGPAEIRTWLEPTMERYCELYTVYEWHVIDPEADRIVVYMQNRRDHPSGKGAIDFPGLTILHYAGDGRFDFEEDFWAVPGAERAFREYAAAVKEHDPEHQAKRTRLDWGRGPDWTRGAPSWFERAGR
jgi:SnoaL-like domain